MIRKMSTALALLLILAMTIPALPACSPTGAPDSYTAIVPAILQSGRPQAISVALFRGSEPVSGEVELSLLKDGKQVARARGDVRGNGLVTLNIPPVDSGDYSLRVAGGGFSDEAKVRVESSFIVLLESDKPIYKPGQTVLLRVMSLDPDLKPLGEDVTIEVLDAKGIKVFRKTVTTDEYGMATVDLPLSQEPNLGTWKITAAGPKSKSQLDIKVEEYVLPKYEVKVDLPREWFLVNEPVTGNVAAEYSFGKPVKGELEITASRYVGEWREYATFRKAIDGNVEFTIPAAGYVSGVPGAGGSGNVKLDFAVIETATGYTEKTDRLLTVSQSSLRLQVIPSGQTFKPSLPFSFLVISEDPGNKPVDTQVSLDFSYVNKDFKEIAKGQKTVNTSKGKALVEVTPPDDSVALIINCSAKEAQASKTIEASYSPSGSFIHVEQESTGVPQIGEKIIFRVHTTKETANLYYEVISRGSVIFSDYTRSSEISFPVTPTMAPSSRLLVYQLLPNSEVAADYIPFDVSASYPNTTTVGFSKEQAKPGEQVQIDIRTEGKAKVGLAAVDRSVFILAENRLNLQQVFDELERLYMKPQAELHEVSIYEGITNRGAKDVFSDAGVIVLSNNRVPDGKKIENERMKRMGLGGIMMENAKGVMPPVMAPAAAPQAAHDSANGSLAEVQRIRQFFPETWLWQDVITGADGRASVKVEVPDSITTWMLRAVAVSKDKGLGIAEDKLTAFQPFFFKLDLPYSAVRGEEFPASVAVYNYLDEPQSVLVQLQEADWFELLDSREQTVDIGPSDIGSAEFRIRPTKLGVKDISVTARSKQAADAVVQKLIIESEGVPREEVDNLVLSAGNTREVSTSIPALAVVDSGRAFLTLTSSYLTQTIDGLDKLLQMPFGCGEQNMIVFAPDLYITKYLKESGQLKPEIMAKAEKLMLTGYQRELTYRRSDGSFSAFGQSDKDGSLWLTAFVLKCFAQAKDVMYFDDSVLDEARSWIASHQNADGSFDPVGFVHHQEMLGGLKGKTALTAYTAIAMMQADDKDSASRAVRYLEGQLAGIEDAYTLAITTFALELMKSPRAGDAHDRLMALAREDENGLHWGDDAVVKPLPESGKMAPVPGIMPPSPQTTSIETTAYATLALTLHGDTPNASRAARWLVSRRNAYGGYGSTQDTVVTLEALTMYATGTRADVDLVVTVDDGGKPREFRLNAANYDVLQVVELPIDRTVRVDVRGKGEAMGQVVRRFNLPEAKQESDVLTVDVSYDTTEVAVNDLVKVSVRMAFNPPVPMEAGMTVLDISVPTGFAPVTESIAAALKNEARIKRYDIAGRKVIFYIENMLSGDSLSFSFQVKALYPVRAKGAVSQAYSYYNPEISGQTLGRDITVLER